MTDTQQITLTLNGGIKNLRVSPRAHLADALAEAGSNLPVLGCEHGVCGACTLLMDGVSVRSCLILAVQADGAAIETVQGLQDSPVLQLLNRAFLKHQALQCGYCTSAMLITAHEWLTSQPEDISRQAAREVISGNLCRCTGYQAIVTALVEVAAQLRAAPLDSQPKPAEPA